jgi:hypothetical protein
MTRMAGALSALLFWRKKVAERSPPAESEDWLDAHLRAEAERAAAAMVDGKHYTKHIDAVKKLRRAGDETAAEALLLRLIAAIEREAAIPLAGRGMLPSWYYDQLAVIYRKTGRKDQVPDLMQRRATLSAAAEASGMAALERMRNECRSSGR